MFIRIYIFSHFFKKASGGTLKTSADGNLGSTSVARYLKVTSAGKQNLEACRQEVLERTSCWLKPQNDFARRKYRKTVGRGSLGISVVRNLEKSSAESFDLADYIICNAPFPLVVRRRRKKRLRRKRKKVCLNRLKL